MDAESKLKQIMERMSWTEEHVWRNLLLYKDLHSWRNSAGRTKKIEMLVRIYEEIAKVADITLKSTES